MRGDVGELFEFLVRAGQLGGGFLKGFFSKFARGHIPEDDLCADDFCLGVAHRRFEDVDVGFSAVVVPMFLDVFKHFPRTDDLFVNKTRMGWLPLV